MYLYSPEIAKFLINSGADANTTDQYGQSILMQAIRMIEMTQNYNSYTEIVELLIKNGANVDVIKHDSYNPSPLLQTVSLEENYHSLRILKLLLDKGADLSIKNKGEKNALQIAQEGKKNEMIKLLEDKRIKE